MQEPQEMWVWSLGHKYPLEEEMATHSSILAGIIPMDRGTWGGGGGSYGPQSQKELDTSEWLRMHVLGLLVLVLIYF